MLLGQGEPSTCVWMRGTQQQQLCWSETEGLAFRRTNKRFKPHNLHPPEIRPSTTLFIFSQLVFQKATCPWTGLHPEHIV